MINKKKPDTPFRFSLLDGFLGVLLGLISLGVYIRTLAPSVLPGDSGEFQVLAHQWGIAHCPGYPVYLTLAKIFSYLPLANIAYRVNLFSAFMAALSIVGLYLTAYLLFRDRWASTFASLALAFSYTLWSQAVIAEVYTSTAAFAIFILFFVLLWGRTGKKWLLFTAGLLGGLSLGVHTTVALLGPGILIYLWLLRKKHAIPWVPAVSGTLLGVLLWLGIFYAMDAYAPPANIFNGAYETARSKWDISQEELQNPWVRIWFVASAQQWRSALDFDLGSMLGQAGSYFWNLPREFSFITLTLILIGLVFITRKRPRIAALLWCSLGTQWIVTFNYRIGDIYVFYLTGYLILALAAAAGLTTIKRWLRKRKTSLISTLQPLVSILVIGLATGPLLLPRLPALKQGVVPFISESGYLLWEDPKAMTLGAYRTVEQMKPESIVFTDWGSLYVYYYVAHIEQGRTDLRFIEPSPRADTPGLPHSVIDFIDANIDSRPIYFTHPFPEVENAGFQFRRTYIWYSTFHQVVRP